MVWPLNSAILTLKEFGFFDVFLPLLLIFFILHAILVKTQLLGDPDKKLPKITNAIVSAIVAFMFVTQTGLIKMMYALIPRSALLLVITMLLLLFLAFVGIYKKDTFEGLGGGKAWVIGIPIILIFLGILDYSGFYIPGIHGIIMFFAEGQTLHVSQDTIQIGIGVLVSAIVLGLIIWVISSAEK